jgi:hypothetical protein
MLNEILNYLNTNGGLLVILSVATAYFLSRSFFRQLTPVPEAIVMGFTFQSGARRPGVQLLGHVAIWIVLALLLTV